MLASPVEAIWPFSEVDDRSDLGERGAALLSRMIQFDTVNPPGNEGPLAAFLVSVLSSDGVEAKLVEMPLLPGGPRRDAVWARVPGNGSARPLILLSHLDVVPADRDEWLHDPFAGEILDGYVHGRGALDAKGVTSIHAMTMAALARRDEPLERDVILLATPDEETGGRVGAGYIVRERSDLLYDAEYLLTEGGSIQPGQHSGPGTQRPSIWGVTITEKSPCWLSLTTRGTPGHGSAPRSDAAIPRLITALDRVRRTESPIRVLAEVEAMFLALAATADEQDRAGFVSLATSLDEDSAFQRRFLANPSYNALVRNTASINVIAGGSRTNVVPGTAQAQIDARLLPGQRCDDFKRAIEAVVADREVAVEILLEFPSRSSPADTPLFSAIEAVARRNEAAALVVPRMIGGFTDAHWFRERGIVAYGFVPRWLTPEDARGIHGAQEKVSIANLQSGTETLLAIIEELAGG
jgi:acetylornithine deacetylase/succinyl-diaminopimelate desuccinylase-like protein